MDEFRRAVNLSDASPVLDQKVERLVGSLLHSGNQIEGLRQVAATLGDSDTEAMASVQGSLQRMMDVHRETETKLQVLVRNFERFNGYPLGN